MRTWRQLEVDSPSIAEAGRRLLVGADGVAIAFLATTSHDGAPRIAPVCPIFSDGGLFLSAAESTPKVRDLREDPRFVLHAFLGANDEEFQIRGLAIEVDDAQQREAVLEAIPFGSFNESHPIFELTLSRALWVHWENVGQPGTRAIRQRWTTSASRERPD